MEFKTKFAIGEVVGCVHVQGSFKYLRVGIVTRIEIVAKGADPASIKYSFMVGDRETWALESVLESVPMPKALADALKTEPAPSAAA